MKIVMTRVGRIHVGTNNAIDDLHPQVIVTGTKKGSDIPHLNDEVRFNYRFSTKQHRNIVVLSQDVRYHQHTNSMSLDISTLGVQR